MRYLIKQNGEWKNRINEVQFVVGGRGGGRGGGAPSPAGGGGPHDSGRFRSCLNPYNLCPSLSTSNIAKPLVAYSCPFFFFFFCFGIWIFSMLLQFLATKKIPICYGPQFNSFINQIVSLIS